MRINEFQLTEHFSLVEFQCPCCHTVLLAPRLVLMLEALRQSWGRPLVVNSGFRCRSHNKEVGGVAGSLHLLGRAVDVRVAAAEQERFQRLAASVGFSRALCYGKRGFVHLETGEAA